MISVRFSMPYRSITGRQIFDNGLAGIRVHKVRRAHADGGGARQHHLDDVLRRGDAAHAHDGDGHCLVDLIHHPHGHAGTSAGPDIAARGVGQQRRAALQIDPHAQQGVDEAHAVGARILAGLGNGGNVGRRWGTSFIYDRLFRHRLDRLRHLGCGLWDRRRRLMPPPWTLGQLILTSSQPTCSWSSSCSQTLGVFLHGKAADIGHHRLVKDLLQLRQLLFRSPRPRRGSAGPRR